MMTAGERADACFSGPGCGCTRLDALNCLDKNQLADVSSLIFCIRGAVHVRGGVLTSTLVVDNDTTVHDVHTYTVAFGPQS